MILYFVLVGFIAGAIGAGYVLSIGGGVLLALLAYSGAGGLGVVLSAVVVAAAPTLPRARRGLPVSAHPASGRSAMRTRHVRVEAQAPRR